jgi:hypothetical protein
MNTFEINEDKNFPQALITEEQAIQTEDSLEEDEDNDILPPKFSISVSRRDFDVDGLVKRLRNGDIYIPDFQRAYVWKQQQASRLIESLLLGLPVPGIFLAIESETNKLLVLDGQQRLISLLSFYDGKFPNSRISFSLKGVHPQFDGQTYKSLVDADRRQLDNSVLSATVVEAHNKNEESIYYIFERLNTGGTLLKPQEIRGCIYHGELNNLLAQLNKTEDWLNIYGKPDKNRRDQELILRFLALYYQSEDYKPSMKEFLNKFMSKNRHLKDISKEEMSQLFIKTIGVISQGIGNKAFRRYKTFVPTFFESVMVSIARRLSKGDIDNFHELNKCYHQLLKDENFLKVSVKIRDLTNEYNVKERLRLATEAFNNLK